MQNKKKNSVSSIKFYCLLTAAPQKQPLGDISYTYLYVLYLYIHTLHSSANHSFAAIQFYLLQFGTCKFIPYQLSLLHRALRSTHWPVQLCMYACQFCCDIKLDAHIAKNTYGGVVSAPLMTQWNKNAGFILC